MSNEDILIKAIEKAIKGGFEAEFKGEYVTIPLGNTRLTCDLDGWDEGNESYHIIFDHRFAKAFWGEKEIRIEHSHAWDDEGNPIESETWMDCIPAWQYHLQQMVISEDPIKYLEKFI